MTNTLSSKPRLHNDTCLLGDADRNDNRTVFLSDDGFLATCQQRCGVLLLLLFFQGLYWCAHTSQRINVPSNDVNAAIGVKYNVGAASATRDVCFGVGVLVLAGIWNELCAWFLERRKTYQGYVIT